MKVYQFVLPNVIGLNIEIPESFKKPQIIYKDEPKFPKNVAYYIAYLIKQRAFLIQKKTEHIDLGFLKVIFWMISQDLKAQSESVEFMNPRILTHKFEEAAIHEQLEFYKQIDFKFVLAFDREINFQLKPFDIKFFDDPQRLFVNDEAKEKLKTEWAEIWQEFELDKYV